MRLLHILSFPLRAIAVPGITLALFAAAPAQAQVYSTAKGTNELRTALGRLSQNGDDVDALIDAGNAALLLDDPDGAVGFFARAEQLDSRNARAKAGLASALLGTENPYEALRLFDQAIKLGMVESFIAADRGLAYDLIGDNESAQRDYRLALQRGGGDDVVRRYALSLGISGKEKESEVAITPLLRKNDSAAWRIRAFILAIEGDRKDARAIATGTMPPQMASAIQPFLDYMPKLTKAQQAAAAHFGHFPSTANIGRPDPRNAQYARRDGGAAPGARADAGLIPTGQPLGGAQTASSAATTRQSRRAQARAEREARRRASALATSPRSRTAQTASAAPASRPAVITPAPTPAPPASAAPAQTGTPVLASAAESDTAIGAVPAGSAPSAATNTGVTPAPAAALASGTPDAPAPKAAPPQLASAQTSPPAATPAPSAQPAQMAANNQGAATAQPQNAVPGFAALGNTAGTNPSERASLSSFDLASRGDRSAIAADTAGLATGATAAAGAAKTPLPSDEPAKAPAAASAPARALADATGYVPSVPARTSSAAAPKAAPSVPSAPGAAAPAGKRSSFAALMADISVPAAERKRDARAVDITKISPAKPKPKPAPQAREKPAEPAKPAPPKNPARTWVQVAGGANAKALPTEYKRLAKIAPEAFKGKQGWTAPLGRTNRVLAGPFDSAGAAQDFVNLLAKSDISAFVWTSDEGEDVAKLPAR